MTAQTHAEIRDRLRRYLARQRFVLYRAWSQPQEDAWLVLNQTEELLRHLEAISRNLGTDGEWSREVAMVVKMYTEAPQLEGMPRVEGF